MAKEFECPVIALVQLNREADKGSRRGFGHQRSQGPKIEQDADQIVLLHPKLQSEDLMPTGVTEVLVTKNRHGKRGIVLVQDQLDVCVVLQVWIFLKNKVWGWGCEHYHGLPLHL